MKNLSEPVLSRVTAKNRLLSVAGPFTNGVFKDTREQAERLYSVLLTYGAKIELIREDMESRESSSSIRQYLNIEVCGHALKFVCVHCLSEAKTSNFYGDLCFYSTE